MPNGNVDKLYQVLDAFEKAGKDKKEIEKIRKLLEKGNVAKALEQIRKLNARKSEENDTEIKNNAITNMNNTSENQTKPKPPKKRKKKIEEVEAEEQENTKNAEKQESTDENDWEDEETMPSVLKSTITTTRINSHLRFDR